MFCSTCQKEIAADSNFCYFCGARQQSASADARAAYGDTGARRLRRSTTDKVFGGVCGGMGEYFDIDPVLIRIVWAVVAVFGGVGIPAYLICWIVIDAAPAGAAIQDRPIVAPRQGTRRLRRSATNAKWAGVCGGIAEHLGMDPTVVRLAWAILTVFPGAIVGGFVAYLIAWLAMPAPEPASANSGQPIPHSS